VNNIACFGQKINKNRTKESPHKTHSKALKNHEAQFRPLGTLGVSQSFILTLLTMVSLEFHFSPSVPRIDKWELFLGSSNLELSSDFITEQNQCAQASMLSGL